MPSPDAAIILSAGPMNFMDLPVGTNRSNALIPVRGKPVIGWILDDLLQKDIRRAAVVVQSADYRLQQFLERTYSKRMDLRVVSPEPNGTILHSLRAGMAAQPSQGLTRVVLGDTLIRDPYAGDEDFLYAGPVNAPRRWCLIETDSDGIITGYLDKQETGASTALAAAGYYHLRDSPWLGQCLEAAIAAGERELSALLRRYGTRRPIRMHAADEWYDFGHIDTLVLARQRLVQSRYFNSVTVDPVLNTITKVSSPGKLQDEIDWYRALPAELQVLTPRILAVERTDERLSVTQEYYGYPSLAELYLYSDLDEDAWRSILRRVLVVHERLKAHRGELEAADAEEIYVRKTFERLDTLARQDLEWRELLARETVEFNGRRLRNLPLLRDEIAARGRELARSMQPCILHGDFCFSNLLFDVNNQILRVIDPRGSFGEKGIYGDPRYDVAKLRHSVCGRYDFIVADLFDLRGRDGVYEAEIYSNGLHARAGELFDEMVAGAGYALDEVRLIEALLFLSMVALHHGAPRRQILMYLTGLSLLNDVTRCES
jgi:dTDP-glucose pyrophosphorylase